jgi:hypothetical protein
MFVHAEIVCNNASNVQFHILLAGLSFFQYQQIYCCLPPIFNSTCLSVCPVPPPPPPPRVWCLRVDRGFLKK